jgi:hypothetical protein
MKNPKTPLSIKVFKTKKYFSDKKSDIKYHTRKIKENKTLKEMVESTRSLIRKMLRNFKDNKENWMDRANADEGFIIDS